MRPTTPKLSLQSLFALPSISTLIISSLTLSLCTAPARAYIPAVPINDTSALNLTDSSTIDISWSGPAGVYGGRVSYQLQADIPTGGRTSGALVHFTESTMGPNVSTTTPWIAYVSCDVNETGASMEWDIFTLARDRGAVSAVSPGWFCPPCLAKHGKPLRRRWSPRKGTLYAEGQGLIHSCCTQRPAIRAC